MFNFLIFIIFENCEKKIVRHIFVRRVRVMTGWYTRNKFHSTCPINRSWSLILQNPLFPCFARFSPGRAVSFKKITGTSPDEWKALHTRCFRWWKIARRCQRSDKNNAEVFCELYVHELIFYISDLKSIKRGKAILAKSSTVCFNRRKRSH